MRIAILSPNFVEYDGGARVAELQAEELAGEDNYVAVFALAANIKPKNADLFIIGMPKNLFWQTIYRLIFPLDIFKTIRWLPKLKNFDEIITHQYPLTWLAYLAKRFYKVKHTVWYHGIADPQFFPRLHERIYIKLQIFLTRLTIRNADRAVAVSKYGQKELKRYVGIDSELVYNKVDLGKFHHGIDGSEIRKKYGLGNAPIILFVGALRPVKGVHLLIQAFKLVKKQIPSAKLIMVGCSDYPYYFKELKRMSDESMIFANYVSHQVLPLYYGACDIYASCSRWEIHNVSALEAQACGKPVITFDIESFQEQVDENGILVETGNVEKFAQACIRKLKQVRELS